MPDVSVGVRSGDTTSSDRRKLVTAPPDILITTPESLYLMLTSAAGETLKGVHTVIVDEVHAVAATKRGAHLAVSLERLDALLDKPAQRIGLSATVRPIDEVARFLGGSAPVEIVAPKSSKAFDMRVVVPIGRSDKVVGVPVNALRKGPSGDHVFVITPDEAGKPRAHLRPVQTGPILADEVLLLDGVKPGEQVATSGSFKLRESVLVAVAHDSAAAGK